MLQVPCLSPPPIYGHSHYKKFWLRQNSEPGAAAAAAAAAGALEHMKSGSTSTTTTNTTTTTTSSSPELPKRLKSSGHRRPQLQHLKVDSIDISPTSSGENWKMKQHQRVSDEELSTVENEEPSPQVLEFNNIINTCSTSLDPVEAKVNLHSGPPQVDDHALDHHPLAGVPPVASPGATTTPADCLTSKCLESAKHEEDHSSDSDSATSSTSQASDDQDSRVKSSSYRQYLKRQTKEKPEESNHHHQHHQIEKFGSPKTRQASLAIADGQGSPRLASASSPMSSSVSRTCKHCGTMKTPLWRNGPLGPKSLCNACGIRLRKARRNNETPGSGSPATNTSGSNPKRKAENNNNSGEFSRQNSYKKSRVPVAREKRELGSIMRLLPQVKNSSSEKFGKQVSTDEEEGAVLLMALSCGLVLA